MILETGLRAGEALALEWGDIDEEKRTLKINKNLVRVDGKNVGNVSELLSAVAALKPGTSSAFNVQRGDKLVELSINPGVRPRPQQRNVRR